MATSRTGIQSEKKFDWRVGGRALRASRLRLDNRPAISVLYPTAHERHGHEQRSAIALKLLFGYLNCRPSNIVVKYSTKGVAMALFCYCPQPYIASLFAHPKYVLFGP